MSTLAFIQNIGPTGIVILFLAVLLIFGPKSLPALGRSMGRALREFRDATNKLSSSLDDSDEDADEKSSSREVLEDEQPAPAQTSRAETATAKSDG